MRKMAFIILTVGFLILSCKPTRRMFNEPIQAIVDEYGEEYRIINTWLPRNVTFYQRTFTNDFEGGTLDKLITDQNINNSDYYIVPDSKLGTSRTLGIDKIIEFKQKAIDLKEVKLRQDLIDGLVINKKIDSTNQMQITFPIISNDGVHAIVYGADFNFGSMVVFKKINGVWEIFSRYRVFETPQYE